MDDVYQDGHDGSYTVRETNGIATAYLISDPTIERRNRAKRARMQRKNIIQQKRARVSNGNSTVSALPDNLAMHDVQEIDRVISLDTQQIYLEEDDGDNGYNIVGERTGIVTGYLIPEYNDFGDPTYNCMYCNAKMWFEERSEKRKSTTHPKFPSCFSNGKIKLPILKQPPETLKRLLFGNDPKSKHFINNIRTYNMMFSFMSMGGKVGHSINRGKGPYVFKIQGANFHQIGDLLPNPGKLLKFSQLYIYNTQNEVQNRIKALSAWERKESNRLDAEIVDELRKMVDAENPFAKQFRNARERYEIGEDTTFKMRLIEKRTMNGRTHNLPMASEVAAIIPGDIDETMEIRDIILQAQGGFLVRISELHPAYVPLQYPLLFPYGEDGYRLGVFHSDAESTSRKRVRLTMREFFAIRIHERLHESTTLFHSRRLFQQFLVDAFTMIESERMCFIRNNQTILRADKYCDIKSAIERGITDTSSTGKRIIPSSYTGGPRYMLQNFQDAMIICKHFSYPDLFITFTCNPKWPEITRFLNERGLNFKDRPDILCRIFKAKLDQIINDFKVSELFGKDALVYTIEFQKRGLPHAHILLFLNRDNKIPNPGDVDRIISAEIPQKDTDGRLHDLVKDYMIHGPCGKANIYSPCMVDNYCSKRFPKKYNEMTKVDDEGYPLYKRRKNGCTVKKGDVDLDNVFVVPYNPMLLGRYQAHINVEWCNQHKSIKYLFKYINKGPDRVTAKVVPDVEGDDETKSPDEIENYMNYRYISPCEAVWRTLQYDIHYRFPPVQRLNFHLPNEQSVVFDDDDYIDNVLQRPTLQRTMFLAWMDLNKENESARGLTYMEIPSRFVWDRKYQKWNKRKDSRTSLGRLQYVPPGVGEQYYLGILIPHSKGAKSHEDIRTIEHLYPTFKGACYAMGLLDDDREYIDGINEASYWASGHYLRNLFAILLISSSMNSPETVFQKTWDCLSDDILSRQRRLLKMPDLRLSDDDLKNYALIEIEKLLNMNGSTLKRFASMPFPDEILTSEGHNKLIQAEMNYDRPSLRTVYNSLSSTLTDEQNHVLQEILEAVQMDREGLFFLYGYGGTGKTFIWRTLSAALRSEGHIVLNVASSGIASLLLQGGRTAHSRFSIPINIDEASTCNMKPGTELSQLIIKAKLIMWDEAPMISRFYFEALDRSLKDIVRSSDGSSSTLPFGGKTVVLGGDFRQILPVIPKGTREDIVHSTLNSSSLWEHCKVLRLTKNMRLQSGTSTSHSSLEEIAEFSEWILKVGDGKLGESRDGHANIIIPDENLICDVIDPISAIVDCIYPLITDNFREQKYFEDRAILAPTHRDVETINQRILSMIPGEEKEYLSFDRLCLTEYRVGGNGELFSTDFLNTIKCSGLPTHRLILKIGVPIMLLRNIDQKSGLCNGTRLIVTRLGNYVLEAQIISGRNIGSKVFIPRMTLTSADITLPIKFQRRQFPVLLCFAMTINKSQGQSLSTVGVYLSKPVFKHGQLYVAVSRVKTKRGLKILCLDPDGKPCNYTTNVVYREVFRNL